MKNCLKVQKVSSPLGDIILASENNYLVALRFFHEEALRSLEKRFMARVEPESSPVIEVAKKQLKEYFERKRKVFDIPLKFKVGTDFQKKCWEALLKIPYGETISYSKQAEMVGNPSAVRAVANANRLNPIAIIVPCHRVIGKNGSLTGYAGGLDKKAFLLKLEKAPNWRGNGTN